MCTLKLCMYICTSDQPIETMYTPAKGQCMPGFENSRNWYPEMLATYVCMCIICKFVLMICVYVCIHLYSVYVCNRNGMINVGVNFSVLTHARSFRIGFKLIEGKGDMVWSKSGPKFSFLCNNVHFFQSYFSNLHNKRICCKIIKWTNSR